MADAKLPTEEDIAKLPRLARVAFAARCARRALPLFVKYWPNAQRHIAAIIRAVEFAELSAAIPTKTALSTAYVADAAGAAQYAASAVETSSDDAEYTADAVEAADAAADAARVAAASLTTDSDSVRATSGVAARAAASAASAGVSILSIAADFGSILTLSRGWDDDTPVPPSVFGSLDEAEPEPVVVSAPELPKSFGLAIEVFARETADPEEAANRLVSLYEKLNEFSLLKYGRGLTVEEFEQFVRAGAPVGAKS